MTAVPSRAPPMQRHRCTSRCISRACLQQWQDQQQTLPQARSPLRSDRRPDPRPAILWLACSRCLCVVARAFSLIAFVWKRCRPCLPSMRPAAGLPGVRQLVRTRERVDEAGVMHAICYLFWDPRQRSEGEREWPTQYATVAGRQCTLQILGYNPNAEQDGAER